jgi:hypothetical protein
MKLVLKIIVLLPALLFLVMGLCWLVDPSGIAPEFGFALADGLGRSSQIGDFASFFLTLALCILLGVGTGRNLWFYPPAMLLLLAATGRVLAWAMHDASFATGMIAVEVVVPLLLFAAIRWLPERE